MNESQTTHDGQIKQDDQIYENRSSALIQLGITPISPGEIVSIRYYEGEYIDTVVAIGVGKKKGAGPSYYSILSDQSRPCITKILENKYPEVTDITHGEIYFVKMDREDIPLEPEEKTEGEVSFEDPETDVEKSYHIVSDFYFVSRSDDSGKYSPLRIIPVTFCTYFVNLEDKHLYFVDPTKGLLMNLSDSGDIDLSELEERVENLEKRPIAREITIENTTIYIV